MPNVITVQVDNDEVNSRSSMLFIKRGEVNGRHVTDPGKYTMLTFSHNKEYGKEMVIDLLNSLIEKIKEL